MSGRPGFPSLSPSAWPSAGRASSDWRGSGRVLARLSLCRGYRHQPTDPEQGESQLPTLVVVVEAVGDSGLGLPRSPAQGVRCRAGVRRGSGTSRLGPVRGVPDPETGKDLL